MANTKDTKDYTYRLIELLAENAGKPLTFPKEVDEQTQRKAIQFMLENSLFFRPDIVEARHEEMKKAPENLPCRYSQKMKGEIKDKNWKGHPIDKDGNYEVRMVIKRGTGEIVSQGDASSIKFAKISHIWGNATHPFYFTSLWNIVLIPAYCNDLMDKKSGDFAKKVQNVYRAVCKELYKADEKLKLLGSIEGAIFSDTSFSPCNANEDGSEAEWDGRDTITVRFSDRSEEPIKAKLTFLPDKDQEEKDTNVDEIKPNKDVVIELDDNNGVVIESYNEEYLAAMSLFGDLTQDSSSDYKSYLRRAVNILKEQRTQTGAKSSDNEYEYYSKSISAINKVLDYLEASGKKKK